MATAVYLQVQDKQVINRIEWDPAQQDYAEQMTAQGITLVAIPNPNIDYIGWVQNDDGSFSAPQQ
jgi:hypothetical protein